MPAAAGLALALLLVAARGAACAPPDAWNSWSVALPDGSRPEGIAAGAGNDLWVTCLSGAIVHVDLDTNTSTLVHREHGAPLSGSKFDQQQAILFVAGTLSGKGFAFHVRPSASVRGGQQRFIVVRKEEYLFKPAGYINDVAISSRRVYFTDSFSSTLFSVPRLAGAGAPPGTGHLLAPRPVQQHALGPFFNTQLGQFRANGIALYASDADGDTLLVANTHTGNLYRAWVPARTGNAAAPAEGGALASLVSVPKQLAAGGLGLVASGGTSQAQVTELFLPSIAGTRSPRLLVDGVLVPSPGQVFVADNFNDRIFGLDASSGLSSLRPTCVLEGPLLHVPTTLAWQAGRLWWVNAALDSCFPFLPCPTHKFEVRSVDPRAHCKRLS